MSDTYKISVETTSNATGVNEVTAGMKQLEQQTKAAAASAEQLARQAKFDALIQQTEGLTGAEKELESQVLRLKIAFDLLDAAEKEAVVAGDNGALQSIREERRELELTVKTAERYNVTLEAAAPLARELVVLERQAADAKAQRVEQAIAEAAEQTKLNEELVAAELKGQKDVQEAALLDIQERKQALADYVAELERTNALQHQDRKLSALALEAGGDKEGAAAMRDEITLRERAAALQQKLNLEEHEAIAVAAEELGLKRSIAVERETELATARAQAALNGQLLAEEEERLLAEARLEAIFEEQAATNSVLLTQEREKALLTNAGTSGAAATAAKQGLGRALGLGLGAAAGLPELAAIIAVGEAFSAVSAKIKASRKAQEEAEEAAKKWRAEWERGVDMIANAKSGVPVLKELAEAMHELRDSTQSENQALETFLNRTKQIVSDRTASENATRDNRIARIKGDGSLSDSEKAKAVAKEEEKSAASDEEIRQAGFRSEIAIAKSRAAEAGGRATEEKGRLDSIGSDLIEKENQARRAGTESQLARERGEVIHADERAAEAVRLNAQAQNFGSSMKSRARRSRKPPERQSVSGKRARLKWMLCKLSPIRTQKFSRSNKTQSDETTKRRLRKFRKGR